MPAGVIVTFGVLFALILLAVSVGTKFIDARRKSHMSNMLHTAAGEPVVAITNLLKEIEPEKPTGFKSILTSLHFSRHAKDQIQQAGLTWSPTHLLAAMGLMAIPGLGLGAMLPFILNGVTTAIVLGLIFGALPYLYVRHKRKVRLDRLEEQFPEALDFLARSMRAGHAFSISLEMLGEELEDPLGMEFRALFNEQNLGAPAGYRAAQFRRAGAAAGCALLHLLGAAAETDRRQFERNPGAARLCHSRALPPQGPGEGGQRARPADGHHPDHPPGGHHGRVAGGGAGLSAIDGPGSRWKMDDRGGHHCPDPGQLLH